MRAALIHQCGESPIVGERATPQPGDGELAVRVRAASITPLDILCASGTSYFGKPATPYVPGVQGVGELEDGTAVWFATTAGMRPGDGSMAEYAIVRPGDIVALPDGIDHLLLAALGLSAVAALMALTWRGGLRPGEQVLVLGGGGVVGQAAIQLALLGGARRVVAACRSEIARERALRVGAAAVVHTVQSGRDASNTTPTSPHRSEGRDLDRTEPEGQDLSIAAPHRPESQDLNVAAPHRPQSQDLNIAAPHRPKDLDVAELAAAIKVAADGPVDLVVDPVFGVPAAAALRALRPGGRLVNLGSAGGEIAPFDSATLRSGWLNVLGYTNNQLTAEQRADALGVIAEHVRAGRLTLEHEVVSLDEIGNAWSRQATGQADRRIVLVP